MRLSRLLVALLPFVFTTAALRAGDMPQYRGTASHAGASSEAADFSDATKIVEQYSLDVTTDETFADPLVVEGFIVIVSQGGDIFCLDIEDGSTVWSKNVGSAITATPAVYNGLLYVGVTDGVIRVYHLATGESAGFDIAHGGWQVGALAISDDRLVVSPGWGNSALLCYDATNGEEIWQVALSQDPQGGPSIFDDKVVVALPDGKVCCFDLEDGETAWAEPVYTKGVFYNTMPAIAQDPDSGDIFVYIAPGDNDLATGSSITGYQGYTTYRINLDTGAYVRIVPGKTGSYAASSRRSHGTGDAEEEEQVPSLDPLTFAPNDLREELRTLSFLDTQLAVIADYEARTGFALDELKQALREAHERSEQFKASMSDSQESEGHRAMSGHAASLPASSFSTTWPTTQYIRPAPASYLAQGSGRFLAIMMREIPTVTIAPRIMLFSVNPSSFGTHYWFYAADTLEAPTALNHAGPLLVPNQNDANGAYIVAPLGRNIAIFDAAAGNTPIFEVEMPNVTYPTPVVANGRLVLLDSGGHLKVYQTTNTAPSAPTISYPAQDANLSELTSMLATWGAATDDSTAQANLRYTLRYAVDQALSEGYTSVSLGTNVTSYDFSWLPEDSDVEFVVLATDGNEATGTASAVRSFRYLGDVTAPGAVSGLSAVGAPESISVSFTPSTDEAPDGDADVEYYTVELREQTSGAVQSVDIGLLHDVLLHDQDADVAINWKRKYTVTVYAYDGRDNRSQGVSVADIEPSAPGGYDPVSPYIESATLYDNDGNGYVETVVLEFSEALSTDAADVNIEGFALDGVQAVSAVGPSGSTLTLKFGAGIRGTGVFELTFDPDQGRIADASAQRNLLKQVSSGTVREIDAAKPVLFKSTLAMHDDDGDGSPNRITVDFSESIKSRTVDISDIRDVRDASGTRLKVTGVALLSNRETLQITLDDSAGSMTGSPTIELADNGNGIFFADDTGNTAVSDLSNLLPVISVSPAAGMRAFDPGLVTFDASASSDPDGSAANLSFEWKVLGWASSRQPTFYGATSATISGRGKSTAKLLLNEPGYYHLRIALTDQAGGVVDSVISFSIKNISPMADAGMAQSRRVGETIELDGGTSSDANSSGSYSDIVTWDWQVASKPTDAAVTIADTTVRSTTVDTSLATPGTYVFRLTVRDAAGASSEADVTWRLFADNNRAPNAWAGPDRFVAMVNGEAGIDLDGGFGSDDGDLSFTWTLASGDADQVTLTNANTAQAHAAIRSAGSYRFTLSLSDGTFTVADDVWMTVFEVAGDTVPMVMVDAPKEVEVGEAFTLDMSDAIDVDGDEVQTTIEHVSGPAPIQLDGAQSTIRKYVALVPGVIVLDLSATDGDNQSAPHRVAIVVKPAGATAPAIRAEVAETITAGEETSIDLSGSVDADAEDFDFHVLQVFGPSCASLELDERVLRLVPPAAGVYAFEVRACDASGCWSGATTVTLVAESADAHLPTAEAHCSVRKLNLAESRAIVLSALNAADADSGDALGYLWVQVGGPSAHIAEAMASTTSVELPNINGSYSFELYVDDGTHRRSAGVVSMSTTGGATIGNELEDLLGSGSGCALLDGMYGKIGLPLLVLGLILVIAALRMAAVRRRKAPDQSI